VNLADITPVILTCNEEANLERTLAALGWAREIVAVDSGSTDRTLAILAGHPRLRVFERPFVSFADQWRFAVHATGIRTAWVLALDADYVVSPAFVAELARQADAPEIGGYSVAFRYCVFGRPLRGSLYPRVTVLFRREGAEYVQDGHAHRVRARGEIRRLGEPIRHDDRKGLGAWVAAQHRYARLEADKLGGARWAELGFADRLRLLVIAAPFAAFAYSLLWRGTLLDGRAGLYYALQRLIAEGLLSLEILERRLRSVAPRG
jgi:glycosyltransferase involved in cell wall biosynthesis